MSKQELGDRNGLAMIFEYVFRPTSQDSTSIGAGRQTPKRTGKTDSDPLHDPIIWYGINYTGTQVTQWDFQNKGTRTSPARLSFVLKVPLRNLLPSVIYSVPCDWFAQRAYSIGRRR